MIENAILIFVVAVAIYVLGFSQGEASKRCAHSTFDRHADFFRHDRCRGRASTTCKAGCCAMHHREFCVQGSLVHCNPFAEPLSDA